MKITNRFYLDSRASDPQFSEATVTGNSQPDFGKHPAEVGLRFRVESISGKRASMRVAMSPDEAIALGNMLLSLADKAGGKFAGLKTYLAKVDNK